MRFRNWSPTTTGGVSTDPGVENVLTGVNYEINGTPLTGTLIATVVEMQAPSLVGQSVDNTLLGQNLNATLKGDIT